LPTQPKSQDSAMKLRQQARGLLDRIDATLDGEGRRALAREAFELVRKAEAIEPYWVMAETRHSGAKARPHRVKTAEPALTAG
jgi:hypothetical protein